MGGGLSFFSLGCLGGLGGLGVLGVGGGSGGALILTTSGPLLSAYFTLKVKLILGGLGG